jgi:DNA polymerase IV
MAKRTPLLQPLSIDEAALDLAGTEALHGAPPAVVLARFVRDVEATVGVTAARRHRCWHPSPVRLLPEIGPTLARRLAAQGITLLGHLQVLSDREVRDAGWATMARRSLRGHVARPCAGSIRGVRPDPSALRPRSIQI